MHVDKLIKGNKCIHVPLHVCRSFVRQRVVSLALSSVCVCVECGDGAAGKKKKKRLVSSGIPLMHG